MVPMNMSFYGCRNYMDVALYKSRSFKVGWGKGLTLAMPWNGLETNVAYLFVRNRIQILDMSKLIRIDPLTVSLMFIIVYKKYRSFCNNSLTNDKNIIRERIIRDRVYTRKKNKNHSRIKNKIH